MLGVAARRSPAVVGIAAIAAGCAEPEREVVPGAAAESLDVVADVGATIELDDGAMLDVPAGSARRRRSIDAAPSRLRWDLPAFDVRDVRLRGGGANRRDARVVHRYCLKGDTLTVEWGLADDPYYTVYSRG